MRNVHLYGQHGSSEYVSILVSSNLLLNSNAVWIAMCVAVGITHFMEVHMKRLLLRFIILLSALLILSTAAYADAANPAAESGNNPIKVGTVTYSVKADNEYTFTFIPDKDGFYELSIEDGCWYGYGFKHNGNSIDTASPFFGKKGDTYEFKVLFSKSTDCSIKITDQSGTTLSHNQTKKIKIGKNQKNIFYKANYTGWHLLYVNNFVSVGDVFYGCDDSLCYDVLRGGYFGDSSYCLFYFEKGKSYRIGLSSMDGSTHTMKMCMTRSVKCAVGSSSTAEFNKLAKSYIAECTLDKSGDYYFETRYVPSESAGGGIYESRVISISNETGNNAECHTDERPIPEKGLKRIYYTGKAAHTCILLNIYDGIIQNSTCKVRNCIDTAKEKDARYNVKHAWWLFEEDHKTHKYHQEYNGEKHTPWRIILMSRDLDPSEFSIKYRNNLNVGTATAIIKGKGCFYGTKKLHFIIRPRSTKIKSVKAGRKKITVKWKKQSLKMSKTRITGYQIKYGTDEAVTKGTKIITVKGYKKTSKVIKKLKSGKKYYVCIRTYKTVKGTKYYSKWTGYLPVKVK